MGNALIFGFIFCELINHFSFIEKLRIFKCDILDFYCKLFAIFYAYSLINLSEGSSSKFFDNFILFSDSRVNHVSTALYYLSAESDNSFFHLSDFLVIVTIIIKRAQFKSQIKILLIFDFYANIIKIDIL